MYKVFVNDKPIIVTDSLERGSNFEVYTLSQVVIDEVIYKLKNESILGVHLYTPSVKEGWAYFKRNFQMITAAGGLVINPKREILFIYRGDRWDLPKGKIEEGETPQAAALREVAEECGITKLTIDKFLLTTHHLFHEQGKHKLKQTSWFLMHSNHTGQLIPQAVEGITEASFRNEKATQKALQNTYANIVLVHQQYIKQTQ